MKVYRNIALALVIVFALGVTFACLYYKSNISKVSDSKEKIVITINEGSSVSDIAKLLKENNLIKSEKIFKLYCKLNGKNNLKATTYSLSPNMDVEKIIEILEKGNSYNPDEIAITFKEGINIRKVATLISENTNNTKEDVFNLLSDSNYQDELINTYWFIGNEIKSDKLFYSLEGYLAPDTYVYLNKDVTVKEIFTKMLAQMDKILKPYEEEIKDLNMTTHNFLTLASIIELEAASSNDRAGVAGVFYNRLKDKWSLGSDVTTYYAEKADFSVELTYAQYRKCNNYNTRCASFIGLPVGPISLPSTRSIKATAEPETHAFYYFVADKNGDTYFTKTDPEHLAKIAELKAKGLWYEYD